MFFWTAPRCTSLHAKAVTMLERSVMDLTQAGDVDPGTRIEARFQFQVPILSRHFTFQNADRILKPGSSRGRAVAGRP